MAGKPKKNDARSELVRSDGALVVTFVNTGSRRSPLLKDYEDLLEWALEHGGVTAAEASALRALASEQPFTAQAVYSAVEDLHEFLTEILNGLADGKAPSGKVVDGLNEVLCRVLPRRVLAPGSSRMGWAWAAGGEEIFRPLWAVGLSAMELLTSEDYGRLKRCDAEGCGVLFVMNRSGMRRRWCSPKSCGDPDRSRRHYHRVTKPARRRWAEDWKRGKIKPVSTE